MVYWHAKHGAKSLVDYDALPITTAATGLNHHASAVNGRVIMAGNNMYGQCGPSDSSIFSTADEDEMPPSVLKELAHASIRRVAAGDWHTLALSTDGDVFSWGAGVLGHGDEVYDAMPKRIEYFADLNLRVIDIAASRQFSICTAVDASGVMSAYIWGYFMHRNRSCKSLHPYRLPLDAIKHLGVGQDRAVVATAANELFSIQTSVDHARPFHPHFGDSVPSVELEGLDSAGHLGDLAIKKLIPARDTTFVLTGIALFPHFAY
jgi:alpha-tubulin suppressor-like RCC1 family protein